MLLTGNNLILELLEQTPSSIQLLLYQKNPPPCPPTLPLIKVEESLLQKITGLSHPQSLAAVVFLPAFHDLASTSYLLVLDGISDPGNLGTLLRTALACGWDGAFLVDGTCDPFNDKALRAAKGATFKLPLREGSWEDFTLFAKERSLHLWTADANGTPFSKATYPLPLALILSKESRGASKDALALGSPLAIPMQGPMESLNVAAAGAILLYHLKEQHGI